MTEFAEAALRYAKLGMAVVPLHPRAKKPMFLNWPEIATSDTAMIGRWWKQTPDANVGIATGQKSRIFVLDVDVIKGGQDSYDSLISKHGQMPETWQQITGTGGFHLFFRYPNFPVGNAAGILPGIDIRGDGGQVVAPPSIHPDTGNRYDWDGLKEIEQTQIAEAPLWLLDMLKPRAERTHSDKFPLSVKIPKGVQHETLVALAGMMRKLGLDEEEIIPSLVKVNETRCTEPGKRENIEQIAHSMMRYRPGDADLITTANRLWRVTKARECEAKREADKRAVGILDGLSVFRSQAAETKCVVDSILYHGLTVFAGRPKIGKSWVTLQLALAVSQGKPFLGKLDVFRPGAVLYVALEESPRRSSKRMRLLQAEESVLLQNLVLVYAMQPLKQGGIQQLAELVEKHRPEVVIIDTFLALVSGADGQRRDPLRSDYEEINLLHKLAESSETAMLLVHHKRKGQMGETGIDSVSGTTGITAAADCIWTIDRQDQGVCSLEVVGRECEEQTLAVRFLKEGEGFGWQLEGMGQEVKSMKDEKEILELVRNEGALSVQRIATLLRLQANRVRSMLYSMEQRGLIHRNVSSGTFCAAPRRESDWGGGEAA